MRTRLLVISMCALLVAVCTAVGALLTETAGASAYPVPASIDHTGTTDVSAALTAFIKSVPDGNTITFPAGAKYRIESGIVVSGRHNLVIDGNGDQFFATTDGSAYPPVGPNIQYWPRHRDQWLVLGGSNVTLKNLTVRGANPNAGTATNAYVLSLEGQAGVEFAGTNKGTLANCSISYTYGDLVYIGTGATAIDVHGCTLTRSGRQGISVADANGVTIHQNNISLIRCSSIDLETDSIKWNVENVVVFANDFGVSRLVPIAAAAAGNVSNIKIGYNAFHGQPFAIQETAPTNLPTRRHDWLLIGNSSDTVFGSPNAAFWLTNTDHVTIQDNTVPLMKGRTPPQLTINTPGSTNVVVSGNSFPYK